MNETEDTGPTPEGGRCEPEMETAVLLDAVIHDMRTPLSAMSGWLEVLEAKLGGETDALVSRALRGLRRSVDSQANVLSTLSESLAQQRRELDVNEDCVLLERLQQAMGLLERRRVGAAMPVPIERLAPLKQASGAGSLTCVDGGTGLVEACGVLLHALVIAQSPADAPIAVVGDDRELRITVPGGSGDRWPLLGLCQGFGRYAARRPDLRVQTLWLARTMLRRCGLVLSMIPTGSIPAAIRASAGDPVTLQPAVDAGFSLFIGRLQS